MKKKNNILVLFLSLIPQLFKDCMTKWLPPTSKGSAVALATPWNSLPEPPEPLLMCRPAPRTCCSTLNARASPVPAAADWLTTAEWTRPLRLDRRTSPVDHSYRSVEELQPPWGPNGSSCCCGAELTTAVLRLGPGGSGSATDVEELLPNLLQHRVLHTWRTRDQTTAQSQLWTGEKP